MGLRKKLRLWHAQLKLALAKELVSVLKINAIFSRYYRMNFHTVGGILS